MVSIIAFCVIGFGDFSWAGFAGSPPKTPAPPVIKDPPNPIPVTPPAPAPTSPVEPVKPKTWTLIYRNDSRGYQCQGYTERDLDSFIRGRESVFNQQVQTYNYVQPIQYSQPLQSYMLSQSTCGPGGCSPN